jgi:maleylacetate reductase
VIVRWGLQEAASVLAELGIDSPLLVAGERWRGRELPFEPASRWAEVPSDRIAEATAGAGDGVVALGGGSAIDLGKAVSAQARVPLVSIPTTYAGAEWTPYFGIRAPDRTMRGGGAGANLAAAVYEPELTLTLPRAETVGTAMNALAHCAEALYVHAHNPEADEHALTGARLIALHLPAVVQAPLDLGERRGLLEGAMHAGMALGASMLALGHAMAQALGGRYGLPHGAMNAIVLPSALEFNRVAAPDAVARLGDALDGEPIERVRELAGLGGFERLRDFGVPEADLPAVAAAAAERPGAKANPRPVEAGDVERLLRAAW